MSEARHEAEKKERLTPNTKTLQVPSVGRLVHYMVYAGDPTTGDMIVVPMAAIISHVETAADPYSRVSLTVFSPSGILFMTDVQHHSGPGGWDWPTYVPPVTVSDEIESDSDSFDTEK